jgi:hypothetical protein
MAFSWRLKGMKFSIACIAGLVLILGTNGCRNPINARTADRYYQAGSRAESVGDLTLARQDYYRSFWNTQAGLLGPAAEAAALYEWSRVTGYLGNYAEAEWGLTNTLMRIEKAKGEADRLKAPTLCELARMLRDTKNYSRAVPVFQEAIQEVESRDLVKPDPIGFAEFLDDYAHSLKEVGLNDQAAEVERRSAGIRAQYPGASAKFKYRRYAE